MKCCENRKNVQIIKRYDPKPKNSDGSIVNFLFRWDDGKDGFRELVRCNLCGKFYLVQIYKLHKFSEKRKILFEDWFPVEGEASADFVNRTHTGLQLERKMKPVFYYENKEEAGD